MWFLKETGMQNKNLTSTPIVKKKSLTVVLMLLRKLSGWLNLNCTSGVNLLLEASQAGCAPSSKVSKRRT